MTTPYENLANAIILMAVKDYRSALKKLKKRPNYNESQKAYFYRECLLQGRQKDYTKRHHGS
ncbi:hypothetical protein [Lacrimispora defluvii]|uniref:Uncharacterized protein n=1 Tax=Lacrimispora defluvii TaxID=2719233 RepID=A0ABX1VYU7_9FIRM|nr:hypothetical protein [Lacrimispora defluvii]NNJ31997.1 hypothetical protein [Lacrimispora defluvii]